MSRSVWPVAGMAAAIGIVAVVASGASSGESAAPPTPIASKPSPTPTPIPVFVVPRGMGVADLEIVHRWLDENDDCRGSSDAATIARECPKRDVDQKRMEVRGWCFDYPDKPAAEAAWHRCASAATISGNLDFKDRWRPEAERVGHLYFLAECRQSPWQVADAADSETQGRLSRDPDWQGLSDAERVALTRWYNQTVRTSAMLSGRCP